MQHEVHNPSVVICIHLVSEKSTKWFGIERDGKYDFMCEECEKQGGKGTMDNLTLACAQCVDIHRRKLGLPLIGDKLKVNHEGKQVEVEVFGFYGFDILVKFNNEDWVITLEEIIHDRKF